MSGPATHLHPVRRHALLLAGRVLAAAVVAAGGVLVAAVPAAGSTALPFDATVPASGNPVLHAAGQASEILVELQEEAVPPPPEPIPAPTVSPAPEIEPEPSTTPSAAPTVSPSTEPSAQPTPEPEPSSSPGEPEASPSAEATPATPATPVPDPSPSVEPAGVEAAPSPEPATTDPAPAIDAPTSTGEVAEPPSSATAPPDVEKKVLKPLATVAAIDEETHVQPQTAAPPDDGRRTGSIHGTVDAAPGTVTTMPAATRTSPAAPAAEAGPGPAVPRGPPSIARSLPLGGPGAMTQGTRHVHPDGAVQAAAITGSGVAIALNRASPVSVAVDFARAGGGWAGPLVFNVWLRRQLRERRMSQRQLGVLSGVDHSAISRLVNGRASPTLETAAKLVHALRLDWTDQQVATYFELLPEQTLLPTQRVESALRGDGSLDDEDVQAVMHQYLALRRRRKGVAATGPQPRGAGGAPPVQRALGVQAGGTSSTPRSAEGARSEPRRTDEPTSTPARASSSS